MLRPKSDNVHVDIAILAVTGALLTAALYGLIWLMASCFFGGLGTAVTAALLLVATWTAARGVDPVLERKDRIAADARNHETESRLARNLGAVGAILMILFRGDLRAGCGSILIGGPRNLVLAWRLWRRERAP